MKVIIFIIIINLKLFMVAGGFGSILLTEVYQDNDWRTVSGKLPRAFNSMEAVAFNDKILLFGNIYHFISRLLLVGLVLKL